MKLLKTSNLNVAFKQKSVLQDINFSLNTGERVAIIGENGAGKTTLAKALNGLVQLTSGSICFKGKEIHQLPTFARSRWIGYAFQNPDDQIFSNSVYKEIEFGPTIKKKDAIQKKQIIEKVIRVTKLEAFQEEHPYNLPYSMRKIVTLASTLAADPELVILDEPTAGQDLIGTRAIEAVLNEYPEKTFMIVSHDMEFVAKQFSRILVMVDRQIVKDGTPKEVFTDLELIEKAKLEQPFIYSLSRKIE